jgi:hypothetical protein
VGALYPLIPLAFMEKENDIILDEEVLEEELEDETEEVEEDDSTDWKAIAEAEKQRRIKAEQAIAKAKAKKPEKEKTYTKDMNLQEHAIEKTVLRSQGSSKEEIETLEKIAQLNGSSLIDAKEDPIFKAWKEAQDKEVEMQKASLPASKGSRVQNLSSDQLKERFFRSDNPSKEEIRKMLGLK